MAIENQLQVGDIIYGFNFSSSMGGALRTLTSIGVADVTVHVLRPRRLIRRQWLGDKFSDEVQFDIHFRWLPWVTGQINWTPHGGHDVVSGNFSGCWMTVYYEDSIKRVAHVHASGGDPSDCAAAWRTHASQVLVQKEFRPSNGMESQLILGLVNTHSELYRLGLSSVNVPVPNIWRTQAQWEAAGMAPEFAAIRAREAEVDLMNFHGNRPSFRVDRIKGPEPEERFQ
jgi:hypothetical protein